MTKRLPAAQPSSPGHAETTKRLRQEMPKVTDRTLKVHRQQRNL